jgi:hypothetical protein
VKNLLQITGAASHTTKVVSKENVDVTYYRRRVNTPYLLYSLTFQLMDVLIWFDEYSRENSDYAKNKSYWRDISGGYQTRWHKGSVKKVLDNGYATVTLDKSINVVSIHPKQSSGVRTGDTVELEIRTPIAQNIK